MLVDFFADATETLILVPKKNGKTTLMAALALFHLWWTDDAECVIAAASRDQASIMLRQSRGFIRRSEWLQGQMAVKQREIVSLKDDGRIRILAADADTADGVIPTLALVDELHRHKSAELYGVFRDGLGPRNGRMITISTAGDDEASPLGLMRHKAHQLPGKTVDRYRYGRSPDGAFVMHEWALDPADDRDDMSVVKRANPAPWQTEEALRRRHDSPSMTTWGWARFGCGVWLAGENAAIPPDQWDVLHEPDLCIPPKSSVLVGIDLGWKYDCTALVPLLWESENRRCVSDVLILEPPGDGSLLDEREIVDRILWLNSRFNARFVYDPNAGGQQMVQQLEREHGMEFIKHSQDPSPIALADGRLMEAIRRRVLVHDGHRGLRQHIVNAVEKPLGGEKFKFDRSKRGPRKPIDGLRALSMAHSVAVGEFEDPPRPARVHFF